MCGVIATCRALRFCLHHVPVTFHTLLTAMAFPGATGKNTPDRCSRKAFAITRQSFFPCLQLLSQKIKITFKEVRKTDRDSYLSNPVELQPTAQMEPSITSVKALLLAYLDQLDLM